MSARAIVRRVAWRALAGLGVMWGAATASFFTLHGTAGDAALSTVSGQGADPTQAVLEQVRRDYGLDLPLWRQYVDYLGKLLHGDLGESYQQRVPVTHAIETQLGQTVELAVGAIVVALTLSVLIGVLTAKRNRWLRAGASGTELVLASMPTFVIGLVLLLVFSIGLGWFPVSGQQGFRSLVLPALTLALPVTALLSQVLRSEMEDVLEQPFVLTARARGMRDAAVRFRHALRHALVPLVTMAGTVIGWMLGGAVVTESLFNRQGLGELMLTATTNKDIPLVVGVIIFAALAYVVVNLVVDILYTLIDPRVVTR